ncbi:MAG: hypothetical protein MUF04_09395 [Akkermansiaceae bacterium]|nr:hypothetical protein [Akkermansiaceae bacterium]
MSLMEIIGSYSAILILIAVGLGIASLMVRRQRFSIFSACAICGNAFAGLGATFWNLWSMNASLVRDFYAAAVDPYLWIGDFGLSCARAGAVLPACGFAMMLVGFSFLIQKREANEIQQHRTDPPAGAEKSDAHPK